jgi:hypothetical protein
MSERDAERDAFVGIEGMFKARGYDEECYSHLESQRGKMTLSNIREHLDEKGVIDNLEFEISPDDEKTILLLFAASIGKGKDGLLTYVLDKTSKKEYDEIIFIVAKGITGPARTSIRSMQSSSLSLDDKPPFIITVLNFERMLFDICTNMYQPIFHPTPILKLLDYPNTDEGIRHLHSDLKESVLDSYIHIPDNAEEFIPQGPDFPSLLSQKIPILFNTDEMVKRMGYSVGDVVKIYQPLFTPSNIDNTEPSEFGVRSGDTRLVYKIICVGEN